VQRVFQPTIESLPGRRVAPVPVRAKRSQLAWAPILGWGLLTCASPAGAQDPFGRQDIISTPPITLTAPALPPPAPPAATGTEPLPGATGSPAPRPPPGTPNATAVPSVTGSVSGTGIIDSVVSPIGGAGRNDSDELGVTMGGFRLFPQIQVSAGYDSNVFAQNASLGTTGSLYTAIVPSLELRSEWLNHQLRLFVGGGFGFYSSAPTQNYQNYTVQLDGKFEILQDLYVTGSIGYRRVTEALGTPNTAFAQAPTVDDIVPLKLSLYQRFNRFFYEITGTATRYWYTDHSVITTAGLPAASRDRAEFEEKIRLGYEITDDFSVFIQPSMNQRRYVQFINVDNQERDSDGYTIGAGFTAILSPTSAIEGFLGYQTQNYWVGGPTSDFNFGLVGTLNPYAPLTLKPNISRSIVESALSGYESIVATVLGMDFTYIIHDAWTLVGGVSYLLADYVPIQGQNVPSRTDRILRANLGLLYSLRPQIQIGPFFEYTTGSSTDPVNGPNYDRQVISVRLIARQ
jgi:hypothetical protein